MTTDELWELAAKVATQSEMYNNKALCNIFEALSQAYIAGMKSQHEDHMRIMNLKTHTK